MNSEELKKLVLNGSAAEVKIYIEQFARNTFHYSESGEFACYGIRHIQDAVNQSSIEKDEKQRLINDFTTASTFGDELRQLRETVAAQGEQVERLTDLLTAFIEASVGKQNQPDPQEKRPPNKPPRTLATVLVR